MPFAPRIILHAPPWDSPLLEEFVEECIRDGVVIVSVVGDDCERVEDVIDEIVVGDGSDETRFLMTSSHPGESLDAVREFAANYTLHVAPGSPIQEVELR